MRRRALFSFSIALCLGFIYACKQDDLAPLTKEFVNITSYVNINANFCTNPQSPSIQNVKYLFILDHSGSNQIQLTPVMIDSSTYDASATDLTGQRRYFPMQQFLQPYLRQNGALPYPNVYFAQLNFNSVTTAPGPTFTNDADWELATTIAQWNSVGNTDGTFTDYTTVLQTAYNMIIDDLNAALANPTVPPTGNTYQIIFVSDGIPAIQVVNNVLVEQDPNDVLARVRNIVALQGNTTYSSVLTSINFNTVYYYNDTKIIQAVSLLAQMAAAGHGNFVTVSNTQTINYQSFGAPIVNLKYSLEDIFIDNLNTVWWDNGVLSFDSDADGLPDSIESAQGSNPNKKDSDGNGVNDLVEYRLKGFACNATGCNPAGRDPYYICTGYNHTTAADGTVTYGFSSNDTLNDCEKFILGVNPKAFGNNGSVVPDSLGFKNSLPIIDGITQLFADPFGDGMTNYQKLKFGLPVSVSSKKILGMKTREVAVTHINSSNPASQCYLISAKNVPLLGNDDNLIQISIIQNATLLQNQPILTKAVKPANLHSGTITFDVDDFK